MSSTAARINEIIKELTIAEKTESYFAELKALYERNLKDYNVLVAQVDKELEDVVQIEKLSVKGLFYKALGSREGQIEKERQEYLVAALKQKEMATQLELDKYEIDILGLKVTNLGVLKSELQNLKKLREKEIMANPQEKFRSALLGIANEMDKLYSLEVEMVEALKAGDVCISRMNTALSHFGSAKNWGQWDMVGGGIGMIKHGSIDQGMREAFQAKNDLMRFRKELADIGLSYAGLDLNLGQVNSFMDIIFDNLITDWIVQKRIKNVLSSVESVRDKVTVILQSVDADRKKIVEKYRDYERQKDAILMDTNL